MADASTNGTGKNGYGPLTIRLATLAFSGIAAIALSFGAYIFNDFKSTQGENDKHLWQIVNTNQTALQAAVGQLNVLSTQVSDAITRQTDSMNRLQDEEADHEQRIRSLERPAPHG